MVAIGTSQLNFFIGNAHSPRYAITNLTILFNNRGLAIWTKKLMALFLILRLHHRKMYSLFTAARAHRYFSVTFIKVWYAIPGRLVKLMYVTTLQASGVHSKLVQRLLLNFC